MTVLGTHPEIIRLSATIRRLESNEAIEHTLIHTGQNYDRELNEVFFEDLGLRAPDHYLEAAGETFGETYGKIIWYSERVMRELRPDAVLILGDTNSALAAIVAKRLHIPVYHMEAGNRSYDQNVLEETNRHIVDHTSDFNLVYTEHARRHLISEGLQHRRIYLTGSPMKEILTAHKEGIEGSKTLTELDLQKGKYFLVSLHREENVDNPENLRKLMATLTQLAEKNDFPVIVSLHPRTRARLDSLGDGAMDERIRFLKPFGFLDYNCLQKNSACVVSDSGTIAEEASLLGFAAVTPRKAIERPEALDTGSIVISGLEPASILAGIATVMEDAASETVPEVPEDFRISDTSLRVVRLILGTARLSNEWAGVRSPAES